MARFLEYLSGTPLRRQVFPAGRAADGLRRRILHPVASLSPLVAAFWMATLAAQAGDLTLKVVDKAPPKELDESIRNVLQSQAIQLMEGQQPVYEFWFRKEIPLESPPESRAKALAAIKQTTLIGAAVVTSDQRDYKDNQLYADHYTVRFSLQPQDGDHLGTSDYPYYAVLIPAKTDTALDGLPTYKKMVRASGSDTATGHPIIMSLRPPSDTEDGALPKLNEPASEHKSVRIRVSARVADAKEPTNIVFELVYEGKGHTQ